MRNKAKNWFEGLRNNLVKMIEDHDGAKFKVKRWKHSGNCLLYTSPSPRDKRQSRMPSSA